MFFVSELQRPYHLNFCTFLRQVIPSSGKYHGSTNLKNILYYLTTLNKLLHTM